MVGHDNEDRVAEPGFRGSLAEEISDGPVGVFHRRVTAHRVPVVLNPSLRVGVGTVVRDGHYLGEEEFSGLIGSVEALQGLPVGVLVGGPPDVRHDYGVLVVGLLVHYFVAAGAVECAHIVEIAVAAVDVAGAVAVTAEHLPGGEEAAAVRAFHEALAGGRRDAQRHGFKAADGAVARREEVVEDETLLKERVEVRGNAVGGAIAGKEIGAQALDSDKDDVLLHGREAVADGADAVGILPTKLLLEGHRLILRQHLVELGVVQFVGHEGLEEIPAAVLLELRGVEVLALEGAVAPVEPGAAGEGAARQDGEGNRPLRPCGYTALTNVPSEVHEVAYSTCYKQHCEDHPHYRIGLHNVADHLIRVDEVIDGDEVEADSELFPENDLAESYRHRGAGVEHHYDVYCSRTPSLADARDEQLERGAEQQENQHPVDNRGQGTAVFVGYVIEEDNIERKQQEGSPKDVSPRLPVFVVRHEGVGEECRHQGDGRERYVVEKAQPEDGQPVLPTPVDNRHGVQDQHYPDKHSEDQGEQKETRCEKGEPVLGFYLIHMLLFFGTMTFSAAGTISTTISVPFRQGSPS